MSVCKQCNGTRHVNVKGSWQRCGCMTRNTIENRYAEAGVPEVYRKFDDESFIARSLWTNPAQPFSTNTKVTAWIRASRLSSKRLATVAHLLRVNIDADLTAKLVTVEQLIEAKFSKEESARTLLRAVRASNLLIVDLDHEFANKMVPTVIGDLVAVRHGQRSATVYVSEDDAASMPTRYGNSLSTLLSKSRSLVRVH